MDGCNVQCTCYTEHGTLSCLYTKTVETMSSAGYVWYVRVCMVHGLYGMLEFKLCCFIAAEHGRYGSIEDWSEQC